MKKGVLLLLLVTSSLFLLIACQSQENAEETTSNSVDPPMESETDIEMKEQREDTIDKDEAETTEQPSEETVIEEEPPIMYRLNEENWALEPIAENIDKNVLLLT